MFPKRRIKYDLGYIFYLLQAHLNGGVQVSEVNHIIELVQVVVDDLLEAMAPQDITIPVGVPRLHCGAGTLRSSFKVHDHLKPEQNLIIHSIYYIQIVSLIF